MPRGPARIEAIHLADRALARKAVDESDVIGLTLRFHLVEQGEVGGLTKSDFPTQFVAAGDHKMIVWGLLPIRRGLPLVGAADSNKLRSSTPSLRHRKARPSYIGCRVSMATVARESESPARTERSQNWSSSSLSVIPRSPLSISHAVVRAISLSSMLLSSPPPDPSRKGRGRSGHTLTNGQPPSASGRNDCSAGIVSMTYW